MAAPRGRAPEWLRLLTPGARLFVLYSREEALWHERLLCGRVRRDGWSWVVLTPTLDQHEEDFSEALELCACGSRGGVPAELYGKKLFRFDHRNNRKYAELLESGAKLADELSAGGGAGDTAPDGLQVAPFGGAAAGAATSPVAAAPRTKWVALEARHGYLLHDPVDVTGLLLIRSGDRGAVDLPSGPIAVAIEGTVTGTPTPRVEPMDVRLLGKSSDADFAKTSFAQRAQMLVDITDAGWRVQGPHTTKWVLQTHVEGNTTPKQRHFWWRQVLGLVSTDPGVEEHCFLCELMEIAVTRDGMNIAALESFETVSRRFQLWEEFYSEALRIAEAGDHGDDLDERRLFLGNHRSKGLAIVSPLLEQYVATKLQEESAVLKERRKGREERRLARGDPSSPNTSSAHGAGPPGAEGTLTGGPGQPPKSGRGRGRGRA